VGVIDRLFSRREPMYRTIVALVGMPRSGTSWLGQVFDSSPNVAYRLEPIFSYAFKNWVDDKSTREDYVKLFDGIYASDDEFLLQMDKRRAGKYPVFSKRDEPEFLAFKTTRFHHLLKDMLGYFENLKMISIVRHPCGSINSWLNTPGEFPADADPMKEWRTGSCRKTAPEEFWGFDDWKKVTLQHLELEKQYPERFKIIRYEDVVEDPVGRTRELFEFVGLELEAQTLSFLEECHKKHNDDSYAVYKKKDVAYKWKGTLPDEIRETIISEVTGTPLERFL